MDYKIKMTYKNCLFLFIIIFLLSGCVSNNDSRKKGLEYTLGKYQFVPEKFKEKPILKIEASGKIYPDQKIKNKKVLEKRNFEKNFSIKRFYSAGLSLRVVFDILNELTDTNFAVYENIASKKIYGNFSGLNTEDTLAAICRSHGLWYRKDNGFITIMDETGYAQSIVLNKNEKIYAFFMKYSNAFDVATLINTVLGSDVILKDMGNQDVYGYLDPDSGSGSSGKSGDKDEDLSLEDKKKLIGVVPDTGENSSAEIKRAGVKIPSSITVFKKNNCLVIKSGEDEIVKKIKSIIKHLDTPVKQVLLAVKILKINLGEGFGSFFTMDYSGKNLVGEVPAANEGVNSMNVMGLGENTMNYIFSNAGLNAKLELYAKDDRVEIVSTPFLMGADNTEIEFFSGVETPLRNDVSSKTIEIGDAGKTMTVFEVDVEKEEIGTKINIKSFINADNTVTMDIEADIATVQRGVTEIGLVNDVTGEITNFELDGKDKNEFTSIVTIPSMHTIALGGIITKEKINYEKKVPVLGDIPLLGFFFKKTEKKDVKNETIILLTPYVIDDPFNGEKSAKSFLMDNSNQDSDHE